MIYGAFADGVCTEPGTAVVNGISARLADGKRVPFRASCVILCCGTIENVRLLLQPAEDGTVRPWASLPWLGCGFNEHLDAAVATVSPLDASRLLNIFDPIFINGVKYTYKTFSQVPISETESLSAVGMLTMPGNIRNSIAELKMLLSGITPRSAPTRSRPIFSATLAATREVAPLAWRYLRHKRLGSVFRGHDSFVFHSNNPYVGKPGHSVYNNTR